MTIIHLTGKINAQGKLEVELPDGLPPSAVEVTLEILNAQDPTAWENQPWTDEELEALMKTEPKTGAEIDEGLIGDGWSHIKVSGAEWVEEQRRKRRELNQW